MEEEIAAFAARIDELIAARSASYRALQEARDRGVSPAERRGFILTRVGV